MECGLSQILCHKYKGKKQNKKKQNSHVVLLL